MQQLIIRTTVFSLIMILGLAFVAPVARAHNGEEHSNAREEQAHEAELFRTETKDAAKTRLNDAKKRVCENRQKNIEAIMTRSVKRAENQTALFTNIASRVKAFYEEKGKVVASYDELVAAIDTAKTTLDADIAALKAAAGFDCSSDDPKGEVKAFQEAHQQVLSSLKDYRTAVKNLIVGVRGAQSQGGEQ